MYRPAFSEGNSLYSSGGSHAHIAPGTEASDRRPSRAGGSWDRGPEAPRSGKGPQKERSTQKPGALKLLPGYIFKDLFRFYISYLNLAAGATGTAHAVPCGPQQVRRIMSNLSQS